MLLQSAAQPCRKNVIIKNQTCHNREESGLKVVINAGSSSIGVMLCDFFPGPVSTFL